MYRLHKDTGDPLESAGRGCKAPTQILSMFFGKQETTFVPIDVDGVMAKQRT